MTIGREAFHYSSTMSTTIRGDPIFTVSTAAATNVTKVEITDLKITSLVPRAVEFGIFGTTGPGVQNLSFDVGSTSDSLNFSWNTPVPMYIAASTAETRYFAGTTDGAGVKFSISGYIERA